MPSGVSSIYPRFAPSFLGQLNTFQTGGNVYFVQSTASNASDAADHGTYPTPGTLSPGVGAAQSSGPGPFKTLNFALTRTANNQGDIIYVLPGHVETIATAAALTFPTATANGVTVVFCGNETDRALVNFSATVGTVTIPANNVHIYGMLVTNSIDALVSGISVTGTDFKATNCEWRDGAITNTLIGWTTTTAAKRFNMIGYRYYEDKTGGGTQKTEHIRIVGGDHHKFEDVHVTGDFSTGCFNNITTLFTEAVFNRCSFNNLNTAPHVAMAMLTTSTGVGFQVVLVVASGTTGITASNKISFDKTSSMAGPGVVQPATS